MRIATAQHFFAVLSTRHLLTILDESDSAALSLNQFFWSHRLPQKNEFRSVLAE
jgi:hypothetical protein